MAYFRLRILNQTVKQIIHFNLGNQLLELVSNLLNRNIDVLFSWKMLKWSISIMRIKHKLTKWESINLLFTASRSLNKDFWVKLLLKNLFNYFKINHLLLTLRLTGQQREQFQELKIKDLADHVGHLQLLHHVSHGLYYKRRLLIYQNNNWLIVQDPMETTDAMEDRDLLH